MSFCTLLGRHHSVIQMVVMWEKISGYHTGASSCRCPLDGFTRESRGSVWPLYVASISTGYHSSWWSLFDATTTVSAEGMWCTVKRKYVQVMVVTTLMAIAMMVIVHTISTLLRFKHRNSFQALYVLVLLTSHQLASQLLKMRQYKQCLEGEAQNYLEYRWC